MAACLVLATLADFGVWWNSGNIELFDEEENTKQDTDVKVKGESNIGLEMETSWKPAMYTDHVMIQNVTKDLICYIHGVVPKKWYFCLKAH